MKKLLVGILLAAMIGPLPMRAEAQTVRALIVTVGSYKDPDVRSLMPEGEQRDDKYIKIALKSVLKNREIEFIELSTDKGVPPERFATQENILEAMGKLRREAQSGDVVIFYFSGHGSRKGGHFSLCPFDASPKTDGNDIADEALANWGKDVAAKTDNVTLILDCCFCEYPTKTPTHMSKFLRRGNDGFPVESLKTVFLDDKITILKASRADEEAQQEDETGAHQYVGVFTRWLCYEMRMPNAGDLTYAQLMQRVNNDVKHEIKNAFYNSFRQTPEIEGSATQRSRRLFQAPAEEGAPPVSPPHLNVSKPRNGKLELNAGSKQGVTIESEYAIYPVKTSDFNRPLGKIRVTDVQENSAAARIVEGSGIRSGDLAVETAHKEPEAAKDSFTLRVEADGSVKSEMEAALRATRLVKISQEKPTLLLKVKQQQGALTGKLYRMDGANIHEEIPLHEASAASIDELVGQVRPWIENLTFLRTLVSLNNPNPGINVKISLEKTAYSVGEKVHATVETLDQNGVHVDCYVTLIDIDANGAPEIIFPKKNSTDRTLRDNFMKEPRDFTLSIHPPVGQETLIAIAMRRPADWSKALGPLAIAASGRVVDTKSVEVLRADIQDRTLDTWAKSIATFVILDQADKMP